MIVNFSVANFRSFKDEQTLNLIANNRIQDQPHHLVALPHSTENVLRGGIFYGANGAGKSNLFKALAYLQQMALRSAKRKVGTGRQPFQFQSERLLPSEFDLVFIADQTVFRYGLVVDDHSVQQEWLVTIRNGAESIIFETVIDDSGEVIFNPAGLDTSGEEVVKLAGISRRKNQTFLSAVRATLEESKVLGPIRSAIRWFQTDLVLIGPDAYFKKLSSKILTDSSFKDFASDFLRAASTGVDSIEIHKQPITDSEVRRMLGEQEAELFLNPSHPESTVVTSSPDGSELLRDDMGCYLVTIQADHPVKSVSETSLLDLTEESDGTKRLLHLLPALHDLRQRSVVYVIDEIDRSLHPHLAKEFLRFFFKHCGNGHKQIITTTHDTNLLDLELIRRDEVWFVRKDLRLASQLFSLDEFKVRNDLKVDKAYLQGRFGAIPNLADIELIELGEPLLHPS